MMLSVFPKALNKLRDEHDRIFGPDFDRTVEQLRNDPGLLNQLEFTTAFIHETLRMFPVGMCARGAPAGM
jgi:cytochrome P450